MPDAAPSNTFNCPNCGAPIQVETDAKTMVCRFCNTSVVIPKDLRTRSPRAIPAQAFARPLFGRTCLMIGLAVLSIGVLGLVAVGVGGYFWVKDATKDIPGLSSITSGFATKGMTFGSKGMGPGMFQDARSVAVDRNGNIVVGDYEDGRVQIFDPSGKYISTFTAGAGKGVDALSFSPDGKLYIVQNGNVSIYDETGKQLGALEAAKGASALAFGADGSLYVLTDEDIVKHFDPSGQQTLTIKNAFSSVLGSSESEQYIAVDGVGNIFIVGPHQDTVLKYSPEGKYIDQFAGEAPHEGKTIPGTVFTASGIGVDGYGRVFLADWNDDIQVFSGDGKFIQSVDALTLGFDTVIYGMTVDSQNTVYLALGDKIMAMHFAKPE